MLGKIPLAVISIYVLIALPDFGLAATTGSPYGYSYTTTSSPDSASSTTVSPYGYPYTTTSSPDSASSTTYSPYGYPYTTTSSPDSASSTTYSPYGYPYTTTSSPDSASSTTYSPYGYPYTTTSSPDSASSTTYSPYGYPYTTTSSPDSASSTTYSPYGYPYTTTSSPDSASSTTFSPYGYPYTTTTSPDSASSTTFLPYNYPSTTTGSPDTASSTTLSPYDYLSTTTTDSPSTTYDYSSSTTEAQGCDASLTAVATASVFTTQNYPYNYDSNMNCQVTITSPVDTAIVLTFVAFRFEEDTYCIYDSFSVYDQATDGTTTLVGTYCGTNAPTTITSSYNALYIVITTDSSGQESGAYVNYHYVDNSYPACKSSYTVYTASVTTQTFSNTNSPYLSNEDEYFLVENPNNDDLILQLTAMNIERGADCEYDRITIYDGACTKDAVLSTHCGSFLKRWEFTGIEYLVHFHTDSVINKNGFTMEYFLGVAGTASPTTTTTTLGPPLSAEIFLMKDVLTNYSVEAFPVKNLSFTVETTVDVFLAGINNFDEVQQKFTTTVQFEVTWYDEGLRWPIEKQSGITKLLIPQNEIWKPDLALLNSFTKISAMGHKFMFVVVEHNGKCTWKPYQILESTCKADMTNYPFDTQECELKFSTWSSTSSQVRTIIGGAGMVKHALFVENSEWHLKEITQRNETVNGQLTAVFTLKMKRNHSFVVFYMSIPVILLSFLNAITFALPTQAGEKASYAITVFLSFLIYVIVTFQKMPENSDTISLFAIYVIVLTGLSNLTVIISVLEIRMMDLKTKYKPVLQCTISFTKWILRIQHRFLCIKEEIDQRRYLEKMEQENSIRRKSAIQTNDDEDEEEDEEVLDNTWPEFVSALDFVCFWVFLTVAGCLAIGYMIYLSLQ